MRTPMILPKPDPAFRWSQESWGPALRCAALESAAQHLFTARQLQLPDDGAWQGALESLHASPDRLMRVRQVHGNSVRVIPRGHAGHGAIGQRPDADALVSNEPGLVLAVMVADCVPILVADPNGAAAAIHAGWRGTCARVAAAAIDAMVTTFGTRPEDLIAAIGPSIGPEDYEVGMPVVDAFLGAGHARRDVERWFSRSTPKPHLDLWTANRDQLVAAGIRPDRILTAGLSTLRHLEVFDSYRAKGDRAGRMGALIRVPG
jgi:purine-nucleoside/S-methyl-5'-thioadenosine phosphorylase / adenosine deaminase